MPEVTPVTVVVETGSGIATQSKRMPEEEHARRMAAVRELLLLPDENPGDTFSGADHDRVLYGEL